MERRDGSEAEEKDDTLEQIQRLKVSEEDALFHAAMVGGAENAKRVLGQSPAAALAVRDFQRQRRR